MKEPRFLQHISVVLLPSLDSDPRHPPHWRFSLFLGHLARSGWWKCTWLILKKKARSHIAQLLASTQHPGPPSRAQTVVISYLQ